MRFAITGTDARFGHLKELLLADGHICVPPEEADVVIPPPWDGGALYNRSEAYQVANAAVTAEAVRELLDREAFPKDVPVLVLGYGRVGRLCARMLEKRGHAVAAAARRREARAYIRAEGYVAMDTAELSSLGGYRLIVNTVPAPLFREEHIRETPENVLLLELASSPGGIDAAAAREQGRHYLRAPGLPGKYAPERSAVILRDALYEVLSRGKPRLGIAMTGSHCSFDKALSSLEALRRTYELVPILSGAAAGTDTAFGTAAEFRARLEKLCGREAVDSIRGAEPLGTREALDALLVSPCTGNTLAKLAHGITDTAVTMACKAHLRNARPLILAVSTNDGLSGSAENIGRLLQRKNVYFVPFGQDAPLTKPFSLQADFSRTAETVEAAISGRQLQPILSL